MTDEPFYSPNRKPAPPREAKPGEPLFEFRKGRHPLCHTRGEPSPHCLPEQGRFRRIGEHSRARPTNTEHEQNQRLGPTRRVIAALSENYRIGFDSRRLQTTRNAEIARFARSERLSASLICTCRPILRACDCAVQPFTCKFIQWDRAASAAYTRGQTGDGRLARQRE
jgi:hypothetical protein